MEIKKINQQTHIPLTNNSTKIEINNNQSLLNNDQIIKNDNQDDHNNLIIPNTQNIKKTLNIFNSEITDFLFYKIFKPLISISKGLKSLHNSEFFHNSLTKILKNNSSLITTASLITNTYIISKEIHKAKKDGKITNQEKRELIGKTIGLFTGDIIGRLTGKIIGTGIGAAIGSIIPIIGTSTGITIGSTVGQAIGITLGSLLGKDLGKKISKSIT